MRFREPHGYKAAPCLVTVSRLTVLQVSSVLPAPPQWQYCRTRRSPLAAESRVRRTESEASAHCQAGTSAMVCHPVLTILERQPGGAEMSGRRQARTGNFPSRRSSEATFSLSPFRQERFVRPGAALRDVTGAGQSCAKGPGPDAGKCTRASES